MPFFDWRCKNCGHVFEEMVPMRDAVNPACPKCGALTEKLVSIPSRAKVPGGTGASKRAW